MVTTSKSGTFKCPYRVRNGCAQNRRATTVENFVFWPLGAKPFKFFKIWNLVLPSVSGLYFQVMLKMRRQWNSWFSRIFQVSPSKGHKRYFYVSLLIYFERSRCSLIRHTFWVNKLKIFFELVYISFFCHIHPSNLKRAKSVEF